MAFHRCTYRLCSQSVTTQTGAALVVGVGLGVCASGSGRRAAVGAPVRLSDRRQVASAIARDPALESRVAAIVAGMTLEQKVGQMTQPEIGKVAPADITRHYIGSVLNGGGSRPGGDKRAPVGPSRRGWSNCTARLRGHGMHVPAPLIWGRPAESPTGEGPRPRVNTTLMILRIR